MTVKFKFDYVINLHDRQRYTTSIDRDGVDEDVALKKSSIQINRSDIKSITKAPDGGALILLKKTEETIDTIEEYTDIIDIIQNANLALDIMHQEKVYIFDDFEVDADELNVCNNWSEMKDIERELMEK